MAAIDSERDGFAELKAGVDRKLSFTRGVQPHPGGDGLLDLEHDEAVSGVARQLDRGHTIPQLVAELYEAAPLYERRVLLEHLLRPLSLLSLFAVANGAFARIWLRRQSQDLAIRLEDTRAIRAGDVTALVDYVSQVCSATIEQLAVLVATSPIMTASSAGRRLAAALDCGARLPG